MTEERTTGLSVVVEKLVSQEEENQRLREESVEDCLRELREMFPSEAVSIEFRDYRGINGCAESGYVRASGATFQGVGDSLSEAMDVVRSWKQEQEK